MLVQNDLGNVLVKQNPFNPSVLVEEKVLKRDKVSVPLVGGDIVNTESGICLAVGVTNSSKPNAEQCLEPGVCLMCGAASCNSYSGTATEPCRWSGNAFSEKKNSVASVGQSTEPYRGSGNAFPEKKK